MTISGAFAGFDPAEAGIVGVFADSRVTTGDHTFSDDAQKVLPLSSRACATAAGDATAIVAVYDLVCREIAETTAARVREGASPLSLWHEASFLFYEIEKYREAKGLTSTCHVVVAGFVSNGAPALAQATFAEGTHERHLFKPLPGQTVSRIVGLQGAVQIVAEVVRHSIARRDSFAALVSVAHAIAQDRSREFEGIGGPISTAYCDGSGFVFPVYEIDGHYFQRGRTLDGPPPDHPVVRVATDAELFARFDTENQATRKFTGGVTRASSIYSPPMCLGFEKLFWEEEPAWVCDDSMPVPYVYGVEGEGGVGMSFDYPNSGGLHPRELESLRYHAGGPRITEPPPASVRNAPTAPDELVVCTGPITIAISHKEGFR